MLSSKLLSLREIYFSICNISIHLKICIFLISIRFRNYCYPELEVKNKIELTAFNFYNKSNAGWCNGSGFFGTTRR